MFAFCISFKLKYLLRLLGYNTTLTYSIVVTVTHRSVSSKIPSSLVLSVPSTKEGPLRFTKSQLQPTCMQNYMLKCALK